MTKKWRNGQGHEAQAGSYPGTRSSNRKALRQAEEGVS
jgi:hypothetical protein